jgi:DnaK suppressor protein
VTTRKESSIKEIGKIKDELLTRKLELEEILTRLYKEKFSDGQVQDFGDQAISSTMESLQASLQDSRLEEYNRIIKALQMIADGTYGICVDCHGAISEKRLKSYPNATRCIACQEAYEEEMGERFP